MRKARITGKDRFVRPAYHCMSRGYDGNWIFGSDVEKDFFRKLLGSVVRFTGVELLTHSTMSNHFHLVIRVPPMPEGGLSDEALLERMKHLFSRATIADLRRRLGAARESGDDALADHWREKYVGRMHSLSFFMKELKQRYSQWYNKRVGRKGSLWEGRFKSVLVEDGEALHTMCKYVDLNPVRAGLVKDPKDYRWCGYAEAEAGVKASRAGLCSAYAHPITGEVPDWRAHRKLYRMALFGTGIEVKRGGEVLRKGVDPQRVRETWEKGGELSWGEVIHCRTRYLTDSLVFGSRGFVERAAEAHKELFGQLRNRNKAHPVPSGGLFEMCSMTAIREEPLGLGS